MSNNRAVVEFQGVYKVYTTRAEVGEGTLLALRDINLAIEPGEFVTLVGPSGCGKSTLLHMAAGLLPPTEGVVRYEGEEVRGVNTRVGYITQADNLLPWRPLLGNVELALEFKGFPPAERRRRAFEFIQIAGLQGFEGFYPHELSGGMRKRAGIIRTLAWDPPALLMDEPFGPLDAQTRTIMQDELLKLWARSRKTTLFVTHDLVESIALSDRIIVMSRQPGSIVNVYKVEIPRPRDVFRIHDCPGFSDLYKLLWDDLKREIFSENGSGSRAAMRV
ncbi:MAG: ABC transporter ATP-binding protein [Candidatus Tectomicrobia bacterium]|nr:ABC transporter ATP-binding protein [Candidatus Tectomicrobia bacterium]